MNCIKKTRGAVSVFLVMILVPCIVVTSVFVDLGRVHMSKSVSNSASDLALNSLMTNFDADLNDWYGMVASCQNIEEFYDISAQFFLRTISSQGLSDDEIILLSDYYANATNDDSIYDLLQIECQTAPSEMISAVTGANLSNAAMIKDQTVEFMKYRAPIELTTGLIEKLKNDSSVTAAIESDANKELVDDKTDYYEAEGELLAAAFNSYVAIYDYYDEARGNGFTIDKMQEYATRFTTYKNTYSQIHKLLVSNLFNTDGLTKYTRATLALDSYHNTYTEKSNEVYSRKETSDGNEHYIIDGTKITALLGSLEDEIDDFNTAKADFESACDFLMSNLPGTAANQSNTIQWWVQMNKAVNASSGTNYTANIKNAGQDLLKAYSKVLAIKKCETGNELPNDWETEYNTLTAKVVELQGKYLVVNIKDNNDKYLKAVNKFEEISSANLNSIKSSSLTVNVNGQNLTIDNAIPHIKNDLNNVRNELQEYIDLLDIAIDGNEDDNNVAENDKVKSLDELLALARNYNSSLATWTNTANSTGTTMAEDDKEEIADIEQVCQEINEESVRTLKTRLINIRSQIKSMVSALDSMQYGGKKIKDIDSFSSFKEASKSKVSSASIKLRNQELVDYSNTTFSQLFSPSTSNILILEHIGDSNYNPIINPETKEVQTPELFVYFQEKFGGLSKQEVNEKKDELNSGEEEGSTQADYAKEKGRYHGGGADISRDFSGDKIFDLADGAISGVIDTIESLINLDISSIRDDLYVTSYIMNMFSYATYEREGLYGLVENKTELTLSNFPSEYQLLKGNGPDDEGTWLSAAYKDYYNKSLTNKLINQTNNVAYGAEVEYILYGGREDKGNIENVKSVYSNIYGIRYVLNLVSGFSNFWANGKNATATAINSVALTIQTATGGIVPIPLTKVILIPILTVFETSKDLDRLEAGFPVELYKTTHNEWWIKIPDGSANSMKSVSGLTSIFKNTFDGPNQDKGVFYSDYLTVFVYLGLKGNAGEAMYQRLAEVVQANMRKLTADDTYSVKKSQLYFQLKAQIRVKPLMITLPYFNDYQNNMKTKTDWCTYNISTVRGYS